MYLKKDDKNEKSSSIVAYLCVSSASKCSLKSMILNFSFVADSESKCIEDLVFTHDFAPQVKTLGGFGSTSFLSSGEIKGIHEPVTFSATIFVEKLAFESVVEGEEDPKKVLLCAHLNNLQDALVSDIDLLYSNRFFQMRFGRDLLVRYQIIVVWLAFQVLLPSMSQ